MKRWLLRVRDVNGKVLHEERFYLRRNAQRTADQLVRPLPAIDVPLATALRQFGPMMTAEISRSS